MKKVFGVSLLILLVFIFAVGCGTVGSSVNATSKDKTNSNGSGAGSTSAKPVQQVVIGTSPTFPKVTFIDQQGNLTGFDVQLVKEIDKRLPGYNFKFQTMDFANLLLSLNTNKIDVVANEMEKNRDRSEKYLFNKVPYAFWKTYIIVAKTNHDKIESLDDLKGKKVLTTATTAEANLLEDYNKTHHNAIEIVYTNGSTDDTVSQITSGRVYATLGADFSLSLIDPQGKLKVVGKPLASNGVYFVFRKDDPQEQVLANKFDQALKEIKADGTLAKLSTKWLGKDYTKNINS